MKEIAIIGTGAYGLCIGLALSKKYNVDMPIITEAYNVINNGKNPLDAVNDLMIRVGKQEFW